MDFFGFGSALKSAHTILCMAQRQTGRTTSLVESLKTGDRVVCLNRNQALNIERLCREREVKITTVVVGERRIEEALHGLSTLSDDGRTVLDHAVVEEMYAGAITSTTQYIDSAEKSLSGYGADHRATRRQAEEMVKWRW